MQPNKSFFTSICVTRGDLKERQPEGMSRKKMAEAMVFVNNEIEAETYREIEKPLNAL